MPRGTKKANGATQAATDPVSAAPSNTTKVTLTLSKDLYRQAEEIANHPDEERTVPNVLLRMLRKDIAIRHGQMFPHMNVVEHIGGVDETELE